jgi:outer membrane immunogenic protein
MELFDFGYLCPKRHGLCAAMDVKDRQLPNRNRGWQMKKLFLMGVALSALVAGPAMAADLAVRAPAYKAPPPVPVYFSWTGCYVGGHVGGLWARKEWTNRDALAGVAVGTSYGSHDADSWLGGVQAGCDYQFAGGFVIGVQGDYAWTNAEGSNANLVPLFAGETNNSRIKSLSTVTGRIGYAWDRFLGYVKGGGAWEKDEYNITFAGTTFATAGETRSGWTVGVGGEYAFTNYFSGFVEYNYYDFGTRDILFTGFFGPGIGTNLIEVKETKSVVRAGLNWRFGGWAAPVTARY